MRNKHAKADDKCFMKENLFKIKKSPPKCLEPHKKNYEQEFNKTQTEATIYG